MLIREASTERGNVYVYRKLTDDVCSYRQIALQSPAGQ
ncbi:hypothetical protein Z945_3606 [Sulfitobacter noctilucae]|nr:hypothetical protein Z945_3606 [Sulfitobacter noctilucae]